MNHCTILNIHFITDGNGVDSSPNHSINPDAALVSHGHFSHNHSIFSYKAIFRNLRTFSVDLPDNHRIKRLVYVRTVTVKFSSPPAFGKVITQGDLMITSVVKLYIPHLIGIGIGEKKIS